MINVLHIIYHRFICFCYVASNGRIIYGDGLERKRGAVLAYFNILSQNMPVGSEP